MATDFTSASQVRLLSSEEDIEAESVKAVFSAVKNLKGSVIITSMRRLTWLERLVGVPVWAKLECQQHSGSFKFRGALNSLKNHPKGQKVIAASAGNHGLAVAEVAALLGIEANICIPANASRLKREHIVDAGAGLIEYGSSLEDATRHARNLSHKHGWKYISPYNSLEIIAGNATIAIEMLEEVPNLEIFIIPVGGGGLLSGMALGAQAKKHKITTYGCEPERYASLSTSIKKGQIERVVHQPTLADGLAVNLEQNSITFALAQKFAEDILILSEEELAAGTLSVLTHESLLVEPAGAASVIACIKLAEKGLLNGPVGIPLAGGNLHHTILSQIQRYPYGDKKLLHLLDLLGRKAKAMPIPRSKLNLPENTKAVNFKNTQSDLRDQILRCIEELGRVRDDYEDFTKYCQARKLDYSQDAVNIIKTQVNDIRSLLTENSIGIINEGDLVKTESILRLGRSTIAYARCAIEWCSPSYTQSNATQFFDLSSQGSPTVNYERYQSTEVHRVEMQLAVVMGVDAEKLCVTVTSSGMSAYTLIESFLIRERLEMNSTVMLAPYIYFEASQQITSLRSVSIVRAESYSVEHIIKKIETHHPRVVFLDPLTNTVEQRLIDIPELIRLLREREIEPITLVIDGTMLPGCLCAEHMISQDGVEIIYYESCSKYLQLGMDASMAGMVIHSVEDRAKFDLLRRNTGTILYRHSAFLFPIFDREEFLRRIHRISHNANQISNHCSMFTELGDFVDVIYPKLDTHPDYEIARKLPYCGGCVTFRFKEPGENYRDSLEGLIEVVISRAQMASVPLSKGVSFGLMIPRISAASAMAEEDPPFLRLYAGDLSPHQTQVLANVLVQSLFQVNRI